MEVAVHAIRGGPTQSNPATKHNHLDDRREVTATGHGASKTLEVKPTRFTCKYCGKTHEPRQCPAYGKVCTICHKRNHLVSVCQQARRKAYRDQKVHTMQDRHDTYDYEDEDDETLLMAPLFEGRMDDRSDWSEDIDIGQRTIKFKLDTGASTTVLPYNIHHYPRARHERASAHQEHPDGHRQRKNKAKRHGAPPLPRHAQRQGHARACPST